MSVVSHGQPGGATDVRHLTQRGCHARFRMPVSKRDFQPAIGRHSVFASAHLVIPSTVVVLKVD